MKSSLPVKRTSATKDGTASVVECPYSTPNILQSTIIYCNILYYTTKMLLQHSIIYYTNILQDFARGLRSGVWVLELRVDPPLIATRRIAR